MAANGTQNPLHVHTLPQPNYIDAVRWIPPPSPFHRLISAAAFDCDAATSTIQILSLTLPQPQPQSNYNHHPPPSLTLQSSHPTPSRISSLKVSHHHTKPLVAASTFVGSLHLLVTDPASGRVERELSLPAGELHVGPISCVDVAESGSECVTVGEDGRVCLVSVGGGSERLSYRRVFDGNGLVGYTAAKWASPTEFATGGLGFGLQWWDLRKPGGPASQLKGNWARATTSGIVHSIDIHPSRKHTCVAGGSSGTVFAWDLRWQQQPIILSGVGTGDVPAYSPCESEVWEVQYDSYMHSKNIGNLSSSRILPVMICSEDGILAVVEQGEEPIELLAEPCAINSFDINRQHPSDVICSLEWESIAILLRS